MCIIKHLNLNYDLSIKKIEPNNESDLWLIHSLEKDPLVTGDDGYLWYSEFPVRDPKYQYLESSEIYDSPFAIYCHQRPIGFLEISKIGITKLLSSVELSYAVLSTERKNGYMKSVLNDVSNLILLDEAHSIDEVELKIDHNNLASQKVAKGAGFVMYEPSQKDTLVFYYKTRKMIR